MMTHFHTIVYHDPNIHEYFPYLSQPDFWSEITNLCISEEKKREDEEEVEGGISQSLTNRLQDDVVSIPSFWKVPLHILEFWLKFNLNYIFSFPVEASRQISS